MPPNDHPKGSGGLASPGSVDIPIRAKEMIRGARSLPCLTDASLRLLGLSAQAHLDVKEVGAIIGEDIALTGRILKVANSAYYGRPRAVGSIEQAVVLLGLDAVRNIAIASSLEACTRSGPGVDGCLRDLWRHSVATAVICQVIATQYAPELKGEAFLAGLLHDLGILVEVHLWPDGFIEMTRLLPPGAESDGWQRAEFAVLGVSHEHLGTALLEHWQFPESIIQAVSVHHAADRSRETGSVLGWLVAAGDRLSQIAGGGLWVEPQTPLDASWDDLLELVTELNPEVRDLCSALWN